MNNIATITAVIMNLNIKRNMIIDSQYEHKWMKPILNKVGKLVPFPALYLDRIISPSFYEAYDPFNNLIIDITYYLVREGYVDISLSEDVKNVLTKVLKDTVGKFLNDKAEELYHVRTNLALRSKEAIPIATLKEYIPMDKEEAMLTSDELLEEEASFYPDDDMLKRRVKQRKKARYERQYRKRRKGDIIPADPDDLFDKV